jgi:hypothetical protein
MKYTTKINQAQYVGKVKIEPKGGELSEKQVEEIRKDPWGKELIEKGLLEIADGKAPNKPDPGKSPDKGAPDDKEEKGGGSK